MNQVYLYAKKLWNSSRIVIGIGGDHSLTWCLLRAARDFNNGQPVAIVHLDSHMDTCDEYHGNQLRYDMCFQVKKAVMTRSCVSVMELLSGELWKMGVWI